MRVPLPSLMIPNQVEDMGWVDSREREDGVVEYYIRYDHVFLGVISGRWSFHSWPLPLKTFTTPSHLRCVTPPHQGGEFCTRYFVEIENRRKTVFVVLLLLTHPCANFCKIEVRCYI